MKNVVYLNNPSPQNVKDIGCFVLSNTGKPFFSDVILFAGNINGEDPNKPELFYNAEITTILEKNINLVRDLQNKGIKVQLAYLGNHQNAGWSCAMNVETTVQLADMMVDDINQYKLDGINIDDEYSNCVYNYDRESFYFLLRNIKEHNKFAGKILTKALRDDERFFEAPTNIASLLNEGYEMSYSDNAQYLYKYVEYGMKKNNLLLGINTEMTPGSRLYEAVKPVVDEGYGGIMIWSPIIADRQKACAYYTEIIRIEQGNKKISVVYHSHNK